MYRFTIDTNLINVRGGIEAMNTLERWQSEGKIELVGAQRLIIEVKGHQKQPAANDKVSAMPNVSEPCVWGIGVFGESKFGADGDFPQFTDLAALLFPGRTWRGLSQNQINDVMHLMGHCGGDAYAFLTNNTKDFIEGGRQENLLVNYNIRVMIPKEAVGFLSHEHNWT